MQESLRYEIRMMMNTGVPGSFAESSEVERTQSRAMGSLMSRGSWPLVTERRPPKFNVANQPIVICA